MKPILSVDEMTMDFGGLRALDHFNLSINRGEIVALIGPNGAGKTTFFNCITGIYTPTGGDIFITPKTKSDSFDSTEKINGLKPNKVTEKGLARTFQNIRLFSEMTVLENVMMGRHCRTKAGIFGSIIKNKKTKQEEKDIIEFSYNLLEKTDLAQYVNDFAKNLPYGAQRRLEIARALATEPFLLLLDEPAAGMNPQETIELVDLIKKIRDEENISILLIQLSSSVSEVAKEFIERIVATRNKIFIIS